MAPSWAHALVDAGRVLKAEGLRPGHTIAGQRCWSPAGFCDAQHKKTFELPMAAEGALERGTIDYVAWRS